MAASRLAPAMRRPRWPAGDWLVLRWSSLVAGVTVVALLAVLAWQVGGYFAVDHLRAGAIALAVAGLLLLAAPPRRSLAPRALAAFAALAAFTLWTGLSAGWSPTPDVAVADFQRSLVYVGLFGLALIAAASRRIARLLPWAGLLLILAVAGYALAGRLLPDVVTAPPITELSGYRLADPLSYWNALGALCVMGLVLALGLAADGRAALPSRGLAAGGAVMLAVAGYLSLSRGSWIALAAGLVTLLAVAPQRRSLLVTVAIAGGCAGLAVARLAAYPALTEDPAAEAGQLAAGHAYLPVLVIAIVAAGAMQMLAGGGQRALALAVLPRGARVAAVAGLVVLGAAGIGLYAVKASQLESGAAGGLVDANGFVERQWDEFWNPATFNASGTERLTTARGTRGALYRVAWEGWAGSPLRGEGAGSFEVRWMRERKVEEKVRDAHSLYLETLTELGLVGLFLLAAFLAALGAGSWATCRRRRGIGAARGAAATGAVAAWAVHSGLDWDWQVPAVTGVALLLGAALCASARVGRRSGPATSGG